MTTSAVIERCDVCGREIDTGKEMIFFCTDYKGRCNECYVKWSGMTAS